ncbi:MAG: PaaI family thioesterase [Pseudomonadota bacterium]
MSDTSILDRLRAANRTAAFNDMIGFEVTQADEGRVELQLEWRDDFKQYAGFLHASLIAGMIDTACGFAASTMSGGMVMASHFSVNCLRPGAGERFIAQAEVVKPGRKQIFTRCELFAVQQGARKLIATGETLLVPV